MEAENDQRIVELILSESFRSWASGEKDNGSWKTHVDGDPGKYPEVVRQALMLVRTIRFEANYMSDEQSQELKRKIAGNLIESAPVSLEPKSKIRGWIPYAAAFFLLLAGVAIGYWLTPEQTRTEMLPLSWESEVAEPGVIKKVVLPDGTRVTLNAGTTLDYPVPFTDRYVKLNGEAYFEVSRDERRPFRVRTRQVETTVLGTSFNINTREEAIKVALISGEVQVQDVRLRQSVTLQPGKMLVAEEEGMHVERFNDLEVTGWRDYVLIYESESLGTIFKDLERIYGVTIRLKTSVDQTTRYTGKFEGEPLDSILKGIGYVSGFSALRRDNEVLVY